MAEEPAAPAPAPAPVEPAAPALAPAAEPTPPAVSSAPEPAPAPAPTEPVQPATPEPAKPTIPEPEKSLLQIAMEDAAAADKEKPKVEEPKEGDKPAEPETKPAEEPKPAEGEKPAKPEAPKTEPIAYEFKAPEGTTFDPKVTEEVANDFRSMGLSKENGEKLIARHASEMERLRDHLVSDQHRVFAETRAKWREEIKGDPELGGSGHLTAMLTTGRVMNKLIQEAERESYFKFLTLTGAGDSINYHRLLYRMAPYVLEDDRTAIPAQPSPQPKTAGERRSRRYSHPSSQAAREK